MKLVRIIAKYKEPVVEPDDKIVILCALDANNRIIDGEWMGYFFTDGIYSPFIFRHTKELFFGGEDNYSEMTNLLGRSLAIGEYFTVSNQPGDDDEFNSVYQIKSLAVISE